jgi:AAA15 family ATPase/GTPase
MLITDIYIEGIPQHEKLYLQKLTDFNVIVGPNNSGKSAVLDVISRLSFFVQFTPDRSSPPLTQSKRFYSRTAKTYTVKWRFQASLEEIFGSIDNGLKAFSAFTSEIKDALPQFGLSCWVEKQFNYNDNQPTSSNKDPFGHIKVKDKIVFDRRNISHGFIMDNISNNTRGYFFDYLKELARIHEISSSQLISYVPWRGARPRKEIMLKLKEQEHSKKYRNFVNTFKEFFPNFPWVRHTSDDTYAILGADEEDPEAMFPLTEEGGGCLRTFDILNEIFLLEIAKDAATERYRRHIRPILLIDEPELSTHADLQREMFHKLVDFSQNAQVFLATHSPIFISPGKKRTVILLPIARSGEEVKYIERSDLNEVSSSLGLRNRDYFLYSTILFLEGFTEQEFLFRILDESEIDPHDHGIDIRNLKGVDKTREKFSETLFDLIINFNTNIIIRTDKEGKTETTKKKLDEMFQEKGKGDKFRWDFWETNFEANFPIEVLHETLIQCAEESGTTLTFSLSDFKEVMKDVEPQNIPNKLSEIYNDQTKGSLNKKQFGRCLAAIILKDPERFKDNQVVKYFIGFFDKLNIEFLTNVKRDPKCVYLWETHKRIADEESKNRIAS